MQYFCCKFQLEGPPDPFSFQIFWIDLYLKLCLSSVDIYENSLVMTYESNFACVWTSLLWQKTRSPALSALCASALHPEGGNLGHYKGVQRTNFQKVPTLLGLPRCTCCSSNQTRCRNAIWEHWRFSNMNTTILVYRVIWYRLSLTHYVIDSFHTTLICCWTSFPLSFNLTVSMLYMVDRFTNSYSSLFKWNEPLYFVFI